MKLSPKNCFNMDDEELRGRLKDIHRKLNRQDDLLVDRGPWDKHKTITNGAEEVVAELLPILKGRALWYIDSYGDLTEIKIKDGKFNGFKPL